MRELEQIKTCTMRQFIADTMQELQGGCDELFDYLMKHPTEIYGEKGTDLHANLAKLYVLQDIAYRLEYGFITEIGKEDLKQWLTKA